MHLEMNKAGMTLLSARNILCKIHEYFSGREFWLEIDQAVLVQWPMLYSKMAPQILKLFYCFNSGPDFISFAEKRYLGPSTEIVICNDSLNQFEGAEHLTATIINKANCVVIATEKFIAQRAHVHMMHLALNEELAVDKFSITKCEVNHNILQRIAGLIQSNKNFHSLKFEECELTDSDCECY